MIFNTQGSTLMAFLDNSGDIILDAVLTDAGRQRLARGNFKITKFALGDEEINYALYNSVHPSGSAFYDLEVMQTPILEAFTNNTSMMKSRLMTMTRNNILYLPILKLNEHDSNHTMNRSSNATGAGTFIVLADLNTQQLGLGQPIAEITGRGILRGHTQGAVSADKTNHIAVDQGIDSDDGGISFKTMLPDDLEETAFMIRCDHRLLEIHIPGSSLRGNQGVTVPLTNQFIDDDGIAQYYVAQGDGLGAVEGRAGDSIRMVSDRRRRVAREGVPSLFDDPDVDTSDPSSVFEQFKGPLGSILRMYPRTSMHVQNSSKLFDEIGKSGNKKIQLLDANAAADNIRSVSTYKYIDTMINVVGVTTGYSMDIPIRIVKAETFAAADGESD